MSTQLKTRNTPPIKIEQRKKPKYTFCNVGGGGGLGEVKFHFRFHRGRVQFSLFQFVRPFSHGMYG